MRTTPGGPSLLDDRMDFPFPHASGLPPALKPPELRTLLHWQGDGRRAPATRRPFAEMHPQVVRLIASRADVFAEAFSGPYRAARVKLHEAELLERLAIAELYYQYDGRNTFVSRTTGRCLECAHAPECPRPHVPAKIRERIRRAYIVYLRLPPRDVHSLERYHRLRDELHALPGHFGEAIYHFAGAPRPGEREHLYVGGRTYLLREGWDETEGGSFTPSGTAAGIVFAGHHHTAFAQLRRIRQEEQTIAQPWRDYVAWVDAHPEARRQLDAVLLPTAKAARQPSAARSA